MATKHFQQNFQKHDWKGWTKKQLGALLNNADNGLDEVHVVRRWYINKGEIRSLGRIILTEENWGSSWRILYNRYPKRNGTKQISVHSWGRQTTNQPSKHTASKI
jgi:hypothetical protein